MYSPEIKQKIEVEFFRGETARENGNEGQARVCARRAVGEAIRAYLTGQKLTLQSQSAVDMLNWLKNEGSFPEEVHQAAENLLVRVNADFQLPVQVDLLAEARKIINFLENAADLE
jgi:hypothetical protein